MQLIEKHKEVINEILHILDKYRFYLGGGSVIMYYFNYRPSEDLDFFTNKRFKEKTLISLMEKISDNLRKSEEIKNKNSNFKSNSLCFNFKEVQISFIYYDYKLINPLSVLEKIHIASPEDVAFMKFLAILDAGRKKDYFDFYFLVKYLNLTPLFFIENFNKRYGNFMPPIITMTINYFDKADNEPDVLNNEGITWEEVKKFYRKFWKL